MVGVPRSKGCRICVQRRVKCDLTKPICNNCKKGNRPCPGYDQDLRFQDEGVKLRKRFRQKAPDEEPVVVLPSESSPSSISASESSKTLLAEGSEQHFISQLQFSKPTLPTDLVVTYRNPFFHLLETDSFHASGTTCEGVVPRSEVEDDDSSHFWEYSWDPEQLQRSGTAVPFNFSSAIFSPSLAQEQLFTVFVSSILPATRSTLPKPMQAHSNWLSNLPPLTGRNPLLDTAVRAVSLIHFGRSRGMRDFFNESRPYYGKALRLLNNHLSDEKKGMTAETLSATVLLSFYEMFSSDSNDSWIRHAGGAGALMKIRGAKRHRYGFDRDIFIAYRHTIVIQAMHRAEPCFLNEPEWRELAWEIRSDIRNSGLSPKALNFFELSEDFFADMTEIPQVYYDAQHLKESYRQQSLFTDIHEYRAHVVKQAEGIRSRIKVTNAKFRACLSSINLAPLTYVSGDPVIPIHYTHANIFIAAFCVGYWTILPNINLLLIELGKLSDPEAVSMYKTENRECGLEICRSVQYLLTSSFLGPFYCTFGLRVCLSIFEDREEKDWAIQKLFEIGNTQMRMANHIPGFSVGTGMVEVRAALLQGDRLEEVR